MPLITWSDKYSVGIGSIDDQHKRLIELINGLNDEMGKGRGAEAASAVIQDLVDYTKYHFTTEEDLMEKNEYPDFFEHRKEHAAFIEKVSGFQADFEKKKSVSLIINISNFLWDWLSKHILVVDKKYSPFLVSRGVK